MRVLVTGARGFVGARLVSRLEAEGHSVRGIDVDVDITDGERVAAVVEDTVPEAVVHLAARSSVADSVSHPAATFRVNFLGTLHLLEAVRRVTPSARVLLVGSGDVYGTAAPDHPPFRETDPFRPRSPYAQSKAAAEHLGRLAAGRGLDVVRSRPFNHTGAAQDDRFVAPSFARQIAEIAAGRREPVMRVGNLASIRDFLDVDDVIDAYVRLLDRDVPAAVYNIASGSGVTVQRVLDLLLELADVEVRIEVDPERMRPTDRLTGDATRLARATGWAPATPLRETLRAVLERWQASVAASPSPSGGA